jgi:hypothetical protein
VPHSRYFPRMPNLRSAAACILLFPLAACASEGFEVAAHTQSVSYRGHVDSDLIAKATPPACAVLPALSPTTYGGLVPLVDMTFLQSIRQSVPGGTIISSGEAMARMNAAGIAGDWQALARDYAASGLLDQARLTKIGRALGVRHLMIPMLGYITTNIDGQLQPFMITIARAVWVSVWGSLQVWDAETGAVEWVSCGYCTIATEVPLVAGYPIHQALTTMWNQMIDDLAKNRRGSLLRETLPRSMFEPDPGQGTPDRPGTAPPSR